jgi:hypothetical protein
MDNVKVVSLHKIFNQNAYCIAKRLNTEVVSDISKPILYIILGAHVIPHILIELKKKYNCKYLILNTEHYNSDVLRNKYYITLLKENYVADYNKTNIEFLKQKYDINVLTLFWFEFIQQNKPMIRSIDILFIGSKNDKRVKIEQKLKKKYPRLNIQFIYPTEYTDITELLLKSKSVLNIPFYDNNTELHRINHALSCRCNVISHSLGYLDDLYKNFIYITGDDYEPTDVSERQNYENLIIHQVNTISTHFNWVVSQIVNELC